MRDCGPCASHANACHLPVFSITNACNMDCPICFTYNRPDRKYFLSRENLRLLLDKLIERRVAFLTDYQNAAYARTYREFVEKVRTAASMAGLDDTLTKAVAKNLFKLMAYKDEYEVARLYSDAKFEEKLRDTFDGDLKVRYNLAPPLLAKRDYKGRLVKSEYGGYMKHVFRVLARLKFLRQTAFDPFGHLHQCGYRRLTADCLENRVARG